eukprot:12273535-Heterocapsa_arctica.AAC.1
MVRVPQHYTATILEAAGLTHAKGVNSPASTSRVVSGEQKGGGLLDEARHRRYRTLVGKLMWLL